MPEEKVLESTEKLIAPAASCLLPEVDLFSDELQDMIAIAGAALAGKRLKTEELKSAAPRDEDSKKKKPVFNADVLLPPCLLLVRAPAGGGKSAVLEQFARVVGQPCVVARCHAGWSSPFHMFEELLEVAAKSRPYAERVVSRHAQWLAPVMPSLAERADAPVDKLAFFHALASVLVETARLEPLVAALDDLDRADPVVLEFLAFLGRFLRQGRSQIDEKPAARQAEAPPRLLIVATVRPPQGGNGAASRALLDLLDETFATVLDLPELEKNRLHRLFANAAWRRPANGGMTRIRAVIEGNALQGRLMADRLSSLDEDTEADAILARVEALSATGLPAAFIASLDEDLRLLLTILSLRGYPLSGPALEALMQKPAAQTAALLAHAESMGLVRRGLQGWFPANTELARHACELLPPHDLRLWHDRIAAGLRAGADAMDGATAFAYFQHAVRGASPRDALDAGFAAAAHLKRTFALQRSLELLYHLLDVLKAGESEGTTFARILQEIIPLEETLNRDETAKRHLKVLLFERDDLGLDAVARARLFVRLARIYQGLGRFSRALRTLSRAFTKKLPGEVVAELCNAVAALRLARGEPKKALNYCLRALTHAAGDAHGILRVETRRLLSTVYRMRGDYARAVDSLLQALEEAPWSHGAREACPLLDQIGALYLEQGNYFRAARYVYRSLEIKRNAGDLPGLAASYTQLGAVYARSGNFTKAVEQQCRATELYEILGDWGGLGRNLIERGNTYRRLGSMREAIACLRNAVAVAERSGDTQVLVSAFLSLAETHFLLGDMKQSENLLRQAQILAQEFKLKAHEACVEQLSGTISTYRRQWDDASKKLQKARDFYASLGLRMQEVEAKLDLAYVLYDREMFADARKAIAKAHVAADELRSPALQARALLIKGNNYRFLEGGRPGKWRECLEKALEVARSVADVHLHFDILYSLGKAFHDEQSFEEADSWYRKAGDILDRIEGTLTEEQAARFRADKRRRIFQEDYARLRREFETRSAAAPSLRDKQGASLGGELGTPVWQDILGKINRLNSAVTDGSFHSKVLGLAIDMVKADRGFLVEITENGWQYAAFRGLRPDALTGRMSYAETLITEALRRRVCFTTTGKEEEEKYGSRTSVADFRNREAILLPITHGDDVLGVLYADSTMDGEGGFPPWARAALDQFALHAATAWQNRRTFLKATLWPGTPFLIEPYFAHVVVEATGQEQRGGRPIAILGMRLPFSVNELAGRASRDIQFVVGKEKRIGVLGDQILVTLMSEDASPKEMEQAAQALVARIAKIAPVKRHHIFKPANPSAPPSELFQAVKDEMNPTAGIVDDVLDLAGCELNLRDAKQLLEKHVIIRALRQTKGNITRAATTLGIHRPQLSQLLRKHELKREAFAESVQ